MALKLNQFRRRRQFTIPVPISTRTRVASISKNRIDIGNLRRFAVERWPEVEAFRPHVLLGGIADLRKLAALADAGTLDFSSIDTAVLVGTNLAFGTISDVERVVLWQAFGVPVYELLLAPDGQLIASECEAHEGWHIEAHMERRTLAGGTSLESAKCACGRTEPRIMPANHPPLSRALA